MLLNRDYDKEIAGSRQALIAALIKAGVDYKKVEASDFRREVVQVHIGLTEDDTHYSVHQQFVAAGCTVETLSLRQDTGIVTIFKPWFEIEIAREMAEGQG